MSDYKNLRLKSVNYGFGWHEYDNPSTDDISNILVRLDDRFNQLEQENAKLKERLKEAEKSLSFYGDFMNYNNSNTSGLVTNIDATDSELLPYADIQYCYGGKKAREYFKKWGE